MNKTLARHEIPVILLAGPTASGKSDLAINLARKVNGVIINADSMQCYRELQILTACPDAFAMVSAPHFLYANRSITDPWAAPQWADCAWAVINSACQQGKTPILVGGSGLYFETLLSGIAYMPPVAPKIQQTARMAWQIDAGASLRDCLCRFDPGLATRIQPRDQQRWQRAYAILLTSGRSILTWQSQGKQRYHFGDKLVIAFRLDPPRAWLREKIAQRFDAMIKQGAVEEARNIMIASFASTLPAMKALGLRPLVSYCCGDISLAKARCQAITATRQYAKRQNTWFRSKMHDWHILSDNEPDKIDQADKIYKLIQKNLRQKNAKDKDAKQCIRS